jgi:hypothetical protein
MRKQVLLAALLLCLLPLSAPAQNQEALVQELYVKSGMENQLAQIPAIIQVGFDQAAQGDPRLKKLPKDLLATMRALAPAAYAPESLKKSMVKALGEKLTVPEIKQTLTWLDTPTGKTCTRAEEDAATPGAIVKMEQFASTIKKLPPSPDRLELLKQLDDAVKGTESNVQIAVNTQIAFALAANATLPRERQRPPEQLVREVEKIRPQVEDAVKAQVRISLLYTYRDLSEAQLQEYIEFLKSPAGAKYMAVSIAALKKALFEGSLRWGKAIGESMKPERRPSRA